MFKKTKRKIVFAIMLSLLLLLMTTLLVIYFSSYYGAKKENADMLERYVKNYMLEDEKTFTVGSEPPQEMPGAQEPGEPPAEMPEDGAPGEMTGDGPAGERPDDRPPEGPRDDEPEFKLSTFYSVAFSDDGEVLKVDGGRNDTKSEEELTEAAREILDGKKTSGKRKGLLFVKEERDGYTLVAFMDSTVSDNNLNRLLKNTLFVGGIALALLFFISLFIANRIVKPLEENDRRQKRFVSDAGHELKTPVAVIEANSELLSREVGDNEWLSNIRYENERMGLLVAELLDLSHAESAGVALEETDLSSVVTGEALPFESVAFEKGKTLVCEIEENIIVNGNPSQLGRLVAILLDNAIRHGADADEIKLSLKRDHRNALLTVENSGEEIPKEKLDHIFERFYRVDEARAGEGRHYGLGLAIAKATVEAHKGSISVACEGGKIIFTVTLPVIK